MVKNGIVITMFTNHSNFTKDACGYFYGYGFLGDYEWGYFFITSPSMLIVRNGILSDNEWADVLKTC